jgi:hypothetical protein
MKDGFTQATIRETELKRRQWDSYFDPYLCVFVETPGFGRVSSHEECPQISLGDE